VGELYAYVGRQAIFDRAREVIGYELLYRDSDENRAKFSDQTQAASTTIVSAVIDLGLDTLVGKVPAYFNLTLDFLLGRFPIPLPPDRVVLEVLEDVPVTPDLLAAVKDLRAAGFKIALDDFTLTPETQPLAQLADVIKVDLLNKPREEIEAAYAALRAFKVPLVAEKVSTSEEYEWVYGLGFERFQGFFLETPKVVKERRLPHDRARLLQVLAKLQDKSIDLRKLEAILASEVGLVVRLLKLASSAALSRGAPITNVGQALSRLGMQQVTALVLLIMATGFDDKPLELSKQALVRARMCEQLARTANQPADQLFVAGLLSLIDALLDQPLATCLGELPVSPVIRSALLEPATPAGKVLEAVRAHGRGEMHKVFRFGFSPQVVNTAWTQSIAWAQSIVNLL
jgi:c-di-GMP phosphodiesterase